MEFGSPSRNNPPTMPTALADIRYNDIIQPSDNSSPSDDESGPAQEYPAQDAQSLVGFSIGHAQSHYTSPTTPAAEKAAAMDDLEGGPLGQDRQNELDVITERQIWESTGPPTPKSQELGTPGTPGTPALGRQQQAEIPTIQEPKQRLPSPWRAGPKSFQRTDGVRSSLRDSLSGHRRRASWGANTEALRKRLTSAIPSIPIPKSPNLLNFSFPGLSSHSSSSNSESKFGADGTASSRPRRSQTLIPSPKPDMSSSSETLTSGRPGSSNRRSTIQNAPQAETPPNGSVEGGLTQQQQSINRQVSHDRLLRRTASDESLALSRSLSRASSLGDDSRFEHVQEQVNSRVKAIKDSWQDANFKFIPSMPNLGISSSLTDLTRGRSTSIKGDGHQRKRAPSSLTINRETVPLPKKSPRQGTAGMSGSNAAHHPHFTKAVQDVTGDVVILGGYRGSILRSAEPPHRQLWVPIKVGLNLRKVDLEVGLNDEDEETMEERVIPGGMLTHIGPVDIARRLFKRLRASDHAKTGELRVHDYGYDWRLSPHLLSRKLIAFLESLPCNQPGVAPEKRGAIVIAHSLGGLITRHAVNQRPELFAGVIYAGTPTTCVNILGPLRNGDDVLLSSRVLTAQVNFTIRTSFALLPLEGKCFFDKHTKEEYPVDFFDVKTWIDNALSPCVAPALPALTAPPPTGMAGIVSSMASVLPNIPGIGRKGSVSKTGHSPSSSMFGFNISGASDEAKARETSAAKTARAEAEAEGGAANTGMAPQMGGHAHQQQQQQQQQEQQAASSSSSTTPGGDHARSRSSSELNPNTNIATAVTIPREKAIAYLTRTLAQVKKFKQELAHQPALSDANKYPPTAVIYGKSIPTVYGARVAGRDAIRRADAYDELAFASGDGVVLARAAMLPEGYNVVRGGVVSSDRGHVTLLGDLEAVGRCLGNVVAARRGGVGLGLREGGRGDVGGGEGVHMPREGEGEGVGLGLAA